MGDETKKTAKRKFDKGEPADPRDRVTVEDLMADAAFAKACCTFHFEGGNGSHACGGDHPNTDAKHSPSCARSAGGDCTCGRGPSPYDEATGEAW